MGDKTKKACLNIKAYIALQIWNIETYFARRNKTQEHKVLLKWQRIIVIIAMDIFG